MKLTTGDTRFPFEVSIYDDNHFEENENFFLTIDRFSLPCDVSIGNQDEATVTILEDECKWKTSIICMHTDCLIIVMHTLVDSMQFYKYGQSFEDDSQELKIMIKQSSTMLFF